MLFRFRQLQEGQHLLFDHETAAIQVESPYTHPALRVRIKRPGALFVRIPPWVQPELIKLDGTSAEPHLSLRKSTDGTRHTIAISVAIS